MSFLYFYIISSLWCVIIGQIIAFFEWKSDPGRPRIVIHIGIFVLSFVPIISPFIATLALIVKSIDYSYKKILEWVQTAPFPKVIKNKKPIDFIEERVNILDL